MRSGTSADALLGSIECGSKPEHVLILAPLSNPGSETLGGQMDRAMRAEIELLHEAGIPAVAIAPDAADLEAFGGSMMDASRAPAANAAGRTRGAALATTTELDAWRR